METTRKIFLFMLINLIVSLHLFSQEEVSPGCLKILKYLKEYPLPVNTTSFESFFKKDVYLDGGTYTYLMNLNSDDIYYLYVDVTKGGVTNLTKGMWMNGKDITYDYLEYNHIAIGYTICDNCIMIYYIGAVPEKDIDVTLNVEIIKFNGERIKLTKRDQEVDIIQIFGAYNFEEYWVKKSAVIENCLDFKTKVILNDDDEESREEYYISWNIDIESGEVLPSN